MRERCVRREKLHPTLSNYRKPLIQPQSAHQPQLRHEDYNLGAVKKKTVIITTSCNCVVVNKWRCTGRGWGGGGVEAGEEKKHGEEEV
jgi:hypothetical protein